jgi:hypothetical protein
LIFEFNRRATLHKPRNRRSLGRASLSGAPSRQQLACPVRRIIRKNPLKEFSRERGALSNAVTDKLRSKKI